MSIDTITLSTSHETSGHPHQGCDDNLVSPRKLTEKAVSPPEPDKLVSVTEAYQEAKQTKAEKTPETPPNTSSKPAPPHLAQPTLEVVRDALRRVDTVSRDLWLEVGRALYEWDEAQGRIAIVEWTTNLTMQRPGSSEEPFSLKDLPAVWEEFQTATEPAPRTIEQLFTLAFAHDSGYEDPTKAAAVARDYYYVPRRGYIRRLGRRRWQECTESMLKRELKAKHNLETSKEKYESANEIDKAIWEVETKRAIDGMAPFAHRREDIVKYAGKHYLNESQNQPVIALSGEREWGEGFLFTAQLIEGMFGPSSRNYILAWMADAYQSAVEGRLTKGPALLMAGGPARGKTLFSNVLFGGLMGGNVDAAGFLLGSQFNDHLFDSLVWNIDDSLAASDHHAHNKFSNLMKKLVANQEFEVNGKYKQAVKLPWLGRLVVTANEDSESLRIIPNMELSVRDKISLVQLRHDAPVVQLPEGTPSGKTAGDLVREELPAFAGWLMNYEVPSELKDTRFGVVAFQDEEMLTTAQQNHPNAPFEELVDEWRQSWFMTPEQLAGMDDKERRDYEESGMGAVHSELTATQLFERMSSEGSPVQNAARKLSSTHVGRNLSSMVSSRCPWISRRMRDGKNLYKILNPHFVGPPAVGGA